MYIQPGIWCLELHTSWYFVVNLKLHKLHSCLEVVSYKMKPSHILLAAGAVLLYKLAGMLQSVCVCAQF